MIAHLIRIFSSLPNDASALQNSISALESDIATLERSAGSPDWWLAGFTMLVAIGVGIEIKVLSHDHAEDMTAWHLCELIPKKPSLRKLAWEIASIVLVIVGILGELGIGLWVSHINGQLRIKTEQLRSKSDQLLTLVTRQVGDASTLANAVNEKAKALDRRLDASSRRVVGLEQRVNNVDEDTLSLGPRWRILVRHKAEFLAAVTPFPKQKSTLIVCGRPPDTESVELSDRALNPMLREAGWARPGLTNPGNDCPANLGNGGGIMVVLASKSVSQANGIENLICDGSPGISGRDSIEHAACALTETLNKLRISTRGWVVSPIRSPESKAEDIKRARTIMGESIGFLAVMAIEEPGRIFVFVGRSLPIFPDQQRK